MMHGSLRTRATRAFLLLLLGAITLAGCGQPLPMPGEGEAAPAPAAQASAVAVPGQAGGRLLYVRGGNLRVWANGQETQLTQEGNYSQPRWSPDGASMLYVRRGDSFADLYVADSTLSTARPLTANQAKGVQPETEAYVDNSFVLSGPSWARAAGVDRIVYSTDRESGVLSPWVLNGLGGKAQPLYGIRELGVHIEGAALSPDGNSVALICALPDADGALSTQIYIVDLNSGNYRPLSQQLLTGAYDPAWSPDGQWIAYAVRQGEDTQIWVIHPDGTGRQRVVADGRNRGPAWSPDGAQIAFIRQQSPGFGLFFVDLTAAQAGFSASKPQRIGDFADVDPASGVSWAP